MSRFEAGIVQTSDTPFKKYESDLASLIERGDHLCNAMYNDCDPVAVRKQVEAEYSTGANDKAATKAAVDKFIKSLPDFCSGYQAWYSEAQIIVKQLLPNRYEDFVRLFQKPKARKSIDYENYVVEDYLQGLQITRAGQIKVNRSAAIPKFQQQLNIVKSLKQRFISSLFDIRQLVQANLFDSELDAARELLKHGFTRAAGALTGVVLERHLAQVASNHNLSLNKKAPGISDWNELLKNASIYDTPQWRRIQHLGDMRNLCTHNKSKEPTEDEIDDLITGVEKVTKTLF